MDYMEKITDLRASKAKLNEQAQALVTEGKFEDANKLADQMEGINKQIQAVERLLDESRKNAKPLDGKYDGILHDEGTGKPKDGKKDAVKPFATLGEQLKAVYDLRKGLVADERLEKVNNAAGITGTNGPDGGFALQEDFAGAILESAVQSSPLLNRLDRYTCSSAANAMRWLHADETDVSTSVFGGIQMYWAAEGATVAASKPRVPGDEAGPGEDDGVLLLHGRNAAGRRLPDWLCGQRLHPGGGPAADGERHCRRRRRQAPGPAELRRHGHSG